MEFPLVPMGDQYNLPHPYLLVFLALIVGEILVVPSQKARRRRADVGKNLNPRLLTDVGKMVIESLSAPTLGRRQCIMRM